VAVVDRLEMVDVQHHQAQGAVLAFGPHELPLQLFEQGAPVQHPGQAVGAGQSAQTVGDLGVLQPDETEGFARDQQQIDQER